jgi:hypothetical protein
MKKFQLKKQELLLLSIWFIIIAVVGIDGFVRKFSARFVSLNEEVSLLEEKFMRLRSLTKQAQAIQTQYDKFISEYRRINGSDSLLQEIEKIAKRTNINLLNIKPNTVKDEGLYLTYSVKIEAQDEAAAIARFLGILTDQVKSATIDRLQINAQNKEELPKATIAISAAAFKE